MTMNHDAANSIISFAGVSKIYKPANDIAIRDVSFDIAHGEFLCIIGPSGEGKSTILDLIAGLQEESSGIITKPENVSMVFQAGALLPWLTVLQNVALGLTAKKLSKSEVHATSMRYIEMMGLKSFEEKYPRDLSGGQRQRVGIARALAVRPSVLLLDEPFSALDPKTTEELHQDIIKIWKDTKTTIVMISHAIEEAVSLADRILLIKNHTVDHTFTITLPRPRRENEATFAHEVLQVRREFFK
jgi:NitT/TauT family transport system ATP-binding protein